ncbi:MAG: hypothetical protein ACPKNR_06640 [Pleomorphochaeta sp.]
MNKSLKLLTLFNQRAKLLYLNGYTKFQILNELRDFYEIGNNDNLTKIEIDNAIFNRVDEFKLDRKIKQHLCNNLFLNDDIDLLFSKINKKCLNVKLNNFKEFEIVDSLLDNPRIPAVEDITLSSSISIYDKPFNGKKITKESYLDLINGILEDCNKHDKNNMLDNLLLFENAFNYLEYSISDVHDRTEIYQELTILLSKLAVLYDLEDFVIMKYFELFKTKFLRDLTYINDNKYIFTVMRNLYSNIYFKHFILFFSYFVENYSSKMIKEIINDFEEDVFLKKNDKLIAINNILIFNSSDKKAFMDNVNSKKQISNIEKDLSILEFAINFEDKDRVRYYWQKLMCDEDYYLYKDALSDIREIVDNFDRIEALEKHMKKVNKNNFEKLIIEVEQLNYLNRKVYSCALTRICNAQLDAKNFNFYFLLILISLGLKDKATIYFYHNINYINLKKESTETIFCYANILFLINYFDFSIALLVKLLKESIDSDTSIFSYIILELRIMKNLIIPLVNDDNIESILSEYDKKGIV